MSQDGFYLLGTISRTHGVKGNVIIRLDVDEPTAYKKLKAVFLLLNGEHIRYDVTHASVSGDHLNLHLEGIEDMDAAEKLIYVPVYLPVTDLPKLKGKKLYLHEAVGMTVVDVAAGELGIIEKIYDLPEQPVASIPFQGKELLLPLISVFFDRIDHENKILYVKLPEGLVDIYR